MIRTETNPRAEAGVAMIMVLAVLAGLMVLAAPLLYLSLQEQRASVGPLARAEARARVEAALKHARYRLEAGHEGVEALLAGADQEGSNPFASPAVDPLLEVQVASALRDGKGNLLASPDGKAYFGSTDPRGLLVDLEVLDDHARPNIWGSPPFLIASVLGRTTLAADLERDETEALRVEDGSAFPLANGRLLIGGEVISYAKREGGLFTGLSRGVDGLEARKHVAESWVMDDRARQIAMIPWKSPRARGGYREPVFPGSLKEITLFSELSFSAEEIDRLEEAFSFTGRRFAAGAFGAKTQIQVAVVPQAEQRGGFRLRVASNEGFGPGTIVRITDGVQVDYGMVAESTNGLLLFEPPTNSYAEGTATVQPLLRHPVNINTASTTTLKRLIDGLQSGFGGRARGSQGRVDGAAADVIISAIESRRPLRDFQEFRSLLEDQVAALPILVNDFTASTVFRNAVSPGDSNLAMSTVPFSFASYDHYTVTAAAALQDNAGRRLAVRKVRERVRVAPPGVLEKVFDTQADFESPYVRARSGRYTVTHPLPVERADPSGALPPSRMPRMLFGFGNSGQFTQQGAGNPDESTVVSGQGGVWPSRAEGDVRLTPVRTESVGNVGALFTMDGPGFLVPDNSVTIDRIDPEGYILSNAVFNLDPRDAIGGAGGFGGRRGQGAGRGGALLTGTSVNPVRVDFWFRTTTGAAAGGPLFDFRSDDPDGGQIQLLRRGQDLVARVKDRTLDLPDDEFEEVMETVWQPQNAAFWQGDTWYHLGLAYRGSKPSDLQLFVDGFLRGQSRFKTRLTSSLSDRSTSFNTEEIEGWPDRGVVMIGTEVIAFTRSGSSFEVQSLPANGIVAEDLLWGRGQRGTKRQNHAAGEEVTLFGYSILPRAAERRERRVIPPGGGRLRSSVGPMRVCTIQSNRRIDVSATINRTPVTLRIDVFDETAGGVLTLLEDGESQGGQEFSGFPEAGGYALIVSREITDDLGQLRVNNAGAGVPLGGLEFVQYQSRSGNQLVGVRAAVRPGGLPWLIQDTIGGGDPGGPVTTSRFISSAPVVHPVGFSASGQGQSIPARFNYACIFPVSIPVDLVQNYKVPETPEDQTDFMPTDSVTYNGQGVTLNYPPILRHPEFVQIGIPDVNSLPNHEIEWIRYTNIDPAGHLLCDEEAYLLRVSDFLRTAYLGQPWFRPEFAPTSEQGIDPDTYETRLYDGANPSDALSILLPFREQLGTERLIGARRILHPSNSEVVPCFRTFTGARRSAIFNQNWSPQNPDAPLDVNLMAHAGYGDVVTLEERGGRGRERFTVSWAGRERNPRPWLTPFFDQSVPPQRLTFEERTVPVYDGHGWIAFDRSIGRQITQGAVPDDGRVEDLRDRTRFTRLLKFPSGELPDMGQGSRAAIGGSVDGQIAEPDARIDEVRITRFDAERYVLWDHSAMNLGARGATGGTQAGAPNAGQRQSSATQTVGIDAATDEIPIANVDWLIASPAVARQDSYLLADGRQVFFRENLRNLGDGMAGLVMIGAEVIAFRGVGQSTSGAPALLECVRGFMNTQASEHAFGEPVVFLNYLPVTMLTDAVDASANFLPMRNLFNFPTGGGTLLINDEMVHYTQFFGAGVLMPRRVEEGDLGPGLFRGRYGTQPRSHDVQSIVLGMPFRYWDRYADRSDSGELAYFEASLDIPGAYVHDLSFESVNVEGANDVVVLVRLDPSIPWDADPARTPGLFEVTATGGSTRLALQRSAEGFDARVFFRFVNGAFDAQRMEVHGWKTSPRLESLRLRYLDQTRVLSREVLR